MTQVELARLTGIDPSRICHYVNFVLMIPAAHFKTLSRALGVPTHQFKEHNAEILASRAQLKNSEKE
jgi:hypothetical protein